MKNIAKDVELLDVYVRKLWGQESRSNINKRDKCSTYFASSTSYNWFGFLERINECLESPSWDQVKSFVEYYCNKRGVDSSSYILLYNNLDVMGYSATFKTTNMHEFYLSETSQTEFLDTFYTQIIDYFTEHSSS